MLFVWLNVFKKLEFYRLRRWYVFDGNIKKATFEMLNERPETCDDGLPVLLPGISGKRRVDSEYLIIESFSHLKTCINNIF